MNAVGCFLIGLIVGYAEAHRPLSNEVQAFLLIGVLGGFTTFSAFGMDTIRLLRDGSYVVGVGERAGAGGGGAGGGAGRAPGGGGTEGCMVASGGPTLPGNPHPLCPPLPRIGVRGRLLGPLRERGR